jgi:RNA polymerase sigma-70 factor (ECF subfamily)
MTKDTTVEQWIAAARKGDGDAFNRLVEHYQGLAFHVAWQQIRNSDEAMDACQEAMLSAWRAMPRFEGSATAFRAWLMRIVVNATRDRWRYEHRRPRRSLEVERDGETYVLPIPAPGPSPQDVAEQAELGGRLEDALATLSPDHRAVVLLDQAGFAYRGRHGQVAHVASPGPPAPTIASRSSKGSGTGALGRTFRMNS